MKFSCIFFLKIVLVPTLASCPGALAQVRDEFPAREKDGTSAVDSATGATKIGYFLESHFKEYFTNCSPAHKQMKTAAGTNASSVPLPILQANISFYEWVQR